MSEYGTLTIDRGLFGHPVFAAEPFTEREAWALLSPNDPERLSFVGPVSY